MPKFDEFPSLKRWTGFIALFAALAVCGGLCTGTAAEDRWTPAQTVTAAGFAAELQRAAGARTVVIYVGVKTLYAGGHIPGALYYGPGSTEQGITELKKFAASLPKSSDVVLYCGCCPLEKCPNLRPAFNAVTDMEFSRLRVLLLPTSFNADWVEKGYAVRKGNTP